MTDAALDWMDRYHTVVIEGCDGVGKSTLASALGRDHAFTVVHCARTPDGLDLMARYETILAVPGRLALDRSFVSEWVYGTVLRGMSRLSMNDIRRLTGAVAERGGAFVHLSATLTCLGARLRARDGTVAWDAGVFSRLCEEYDHVFDEIGRLAEVLRIDTTHAP